MRLLFPLRPVLAAAAIGAAALPLTLPTPAHAWWHGGFFIGVPFPPVVIAPPVYAPPAVVYAPLPAYGAAPPAYGYSPAGPDYAYTPEPSGGTCYAAGYTCPLQSAVPAGSSCSCPGYNGRVWGRSG